MASKNRDPGCKKRPHTTQTNESLRSRVQHLTTELEAVNKELAEIREFYSERVENLNEVLFTIDNEGIFTYLNSAIENITGYKKEEVIGTSYTRYIHPEDLPGLVEDIRLTIAGEKKPYMFRIIKRSGDISYVHTTSHPIIRNGKLAGINGLMVDIAQLKKAELNLKQERDKAQRYLEVVAVIILATDKDGNIRLINKKGCEILGYEESELIGINFFETFMPEDIREDAVQEHRRLMKKETALKTFLESPVLMRDMEVRTFEWNNILLEDEDGNVQGLLTSGNDITERKRTEQALIMAKMISDNAARVKKEFISTMSHELRTPLNQIIGYSDIFSKGDLGSLNTQQKRCMETISRSGERLLVLINSIIEHSQIEEGKMEVQKKEFLLPSVIRDVEASTIPLAKKKDISLHFFLETGIKEVYSDESKFKTILYDLISNAIKFTPERGTVSIKFTLGNDGFLTASVEDTGIGISREHQNKLFKPFSQVDSSLTRSFDGVGLGLYIVKEFVEMLGGNIRMESELGKGSTFTFSLPVSNN